MIKRVAHLLSVTPARPSLRWPAVLMLLLGSGGLLAMQVIPPKSILTNLRFDASSEGELTPGNYREYTASYLGDKRRSYRISMDTASHVEEVYTEDGERKTIDESARLWLKSVTLMNASNIEPPAQLELTPLPMPSPPALPTLKPPPEPSDSDELKVLMASIQSDPSLIAMTGEPVTLDRSTFHGRVHTWGSRDFHLWGIDDPVGGKANFSVTFKGPNGRVNVAWSGKTEAGVWKADSMKLSALPQ